MINKVVLVGRLTKDVELRKTTTNKSVCSFTLACNRRFASSQDGGQTADFINCIAWNQSADFLARYASKGAIVGVDGRIQTRNYDGPNGKVYVTEVVCDNVQLIGGNKSNATSSTNYQSAPNNYSSNNYSAPNQTFTPSSEASYSDNSMDDDFSNTPSLDISSDDLPFY